MSAVKKTNKTKNPATNTAARKATAKSRQAVSRKTLSKPKTGNPPVKSVVPSKTPAHSAPTPDSIGSLQKLKRAVTSARFSRLYAIFCVVTLVATTIVWSVLGATVNQGNADQVVDSYLFESGHTFNEAVFPAQHSFLLKWPLFIAVKLFDFSNGAFIAASVLTALAAVIGLMWLMYRLEPRRLYFGTLCLALASVLLLVPNQPYAGGLLPVNMAMSTTRNIEYIVFIAFFVAASRWQQHQVLKSRHFWLACSVLALLVASDRLFMSLAIGSALLAGILATISRHGAYLRNAALTLTAAIIGSLGGIILLSLINASGLTHIASESNNASPYSLALNPHNLALGTFYNISSFFTNLGANPAFDATILRNLPAIAVRRLFSVAGPAYIVNLTIAIAGLMAAGWLCYKSLRGLKNRPDSLVLSLVCASLTASAAFIATSHAFAVDARYVTIWLFAVFVALATYSGRQHWPSRQVVTGGLILTIAILSGLWGCFQGYRHETAALRTSNQRNASVAQVVSQHRTDVLVGDYWRVLPTKATNKSKAPLNVMPLSNCTQPRGVLTSKAWQPDLQNHSFAYLLSLDKSLTDYPNCSLQQVTSQYGQPSSSVVVDGKLANPKEMLLFYDKGTKPPLTKPAAPASNNSGSQPKKDKPAEPVSKKDTAPESLDELPPNQTSCGGQPTIMNIVAHQDDDLLFTNPDLERDIEAKHCVRTVYITAGDGGNDQFYWLGRERGSQAAYDVMDGASPDDWIQQAIAIDGNTKRLGGPVQYASIASPRNDPSISLIFLRLPDGGLGGSGFSRSHHESLSALANGNINTLHSVDGQSIYDAPGLTSALAQLMQTYRPDQIRSQANEPSSNYPDHSDHIAAGIFAGRARDLYDQQQTVATHLAQEQAVMASGTPAEAVAEALANAATSTPVTPIQYYIGYPIRDQPENVDGHALDQKLSAFFAYAKFDGGVCQSVADCANVPTYYSYLRRQYTAPQPTPAPAP